MKIFYTADTHFNEQRAFDLSMRNMYFNNVEQSTTEMIKRWNAVVSERDVVFHLGDFGDFEVAKQLNGNIVLLYGNYERDKLAPNDEQKKDFLRVSSDLWGRHGIYLLVHEPENRLKIPHELEDFVRGTDVDPFYLFGHIHEKQKVKRNGLNVGVDVHNFTPVSYETVEFYRNAIQNHYDDNCFENY